MDAVGTSAPSNTTSASPQSPATHGLLIIQNISTRQIAFWTMKGGTVTADEAVPDIPPAGWNLVGSGWTVVGPH